MLNQYTNQSITLKTKSSVNEYNEPTYTTSTIKARYQYKRKVIRDRIGQEKISVAQCFTTTAIKPDDVLNFDSTDWIVMAVENIVDLNGNISHYEVYV